MSQVINTRPAVSGLILVSCLLITHGHPAHAESWVLERVSTAAPIRAELVAHFEPFDPAKRRSADLTDMDFDRQGRLHVVLAKPARLHRFRPDPRKVYDGTVEAPWMDLAALTDNPSMKSENVMVDDRGRVFITSGDGYDYQEGAFGTVYRLSRVDP